MNGNEKMQQKKREIDPVNTSFLVLTPLLALTLTAWYVSRHGFHWMDAVLFGGMYIMTGLGITAGYHRYYSHRSYDCHKAVQLFYLVFGAAAIENSVLRWARDHRLHHKYVDQDQDPYNIMRGLFYAHMGWIFYKTPQDRNFDCAPDLLHDPLVRWQDRYYLPILVLVGFGLPTLIGAAVGRPFGGFLFGGLLRAVIVQHFTFCINSLAHYFGSRPYSLDNTARDSWWLAFITYGEGYHNFHHRFAADYRNGHRWWHFDPTKWWIAALARLRLVTRLTQYREEHILKARIETDLKRVEQPLAQAPEDLSVRLQHRLDSARQQLEAAYAHFQQAKADYRTWKTQFLEGSRDARRQWKRRLREYGFQLQAAQARWALLIAAISRLQGHGPLS